MFPACYTNRQTRRQELALETALERKLEGEPTQGSAEATPAANLVEGMHIPLERNMTVAIATWIKETSPEYAWTDLDFPGGPIIPPNIKWPLGLARFRKPQW